MSYIPAGLRREIIERADNCCEYCRMSQNDVDTTFHIEHILAEKHGGESTSENLCLNCVRCNLYKGSNVAAADPETGEPTFLFHPRRHKWDEHFQLDGAIIQAFTAEGRVTIMILRFNRPLRIEERQFLISLGHYPCET